MFLKCCQRFINVFTKKVKQSFVITDEHDKYDKKFSYSQVYQNQHINRFSKLIEPL